MRHSKYQIEFATFGPIYIEGFYNVEQAIVLAKARRIEEGLSLDVVRVKSWVDGLGYARNEEII